MPTSARCAILTQLEARLGDSVTGAADAPQSKKTPAAVCFGVSLHGESGRPGFDENSKSECSIPA
jgi:hypothetical protein